MSVRRILVLILFVAGVTIVPVHAFALDLPQLLSSGDKQDLGTFKLIHVADLKMMMAKRSEKVPLYKENINKLLMRRHQDLYIYDANAPDTRQQFGIIPGATLLSSDDNYALTVLPANKHATLVFYCTNSH